MTISCEAAASTERHGRAENIPSRRAAATQLIVIAIEPTTLIRYALPSSAAIEGATHPGLRRLDADDLEAEVGRVGFDRLAVERRPRAGSRRTPRRRRSRGRSRRRRPPSSRPVATAIESEWWGIVRRTLSEPSIGSMITRRASGSPSPIATSPRSSLIAITAALGGDPLELLEDDVLATAVELEAHVAALAAALVLGPRRRSCARLAKRASCRAASAGRSQPVDRVHAGHRSAAPATVMLVRSAPAPEFEAAVAHRGGAALVLGPAGSGRTELIARRFERLAAEGLPAERIAVLTQGPPRRPASRPDRDAPRRPLRGAPDPTWEELAEKLLRDYALEGGIDPFFEVVGPADRLAILLDRIDDLPLRRHEIRGNPAGLLARLLERIDVLKAEGIGPAELRTTRAPPSGAADRASREAALRELEFADLFERHDSILLERGAIDEPELVLELGRLLDRRPDISLAIGDRFRILMVDELEDAEPSRSGLLALLAPHEQVLATCDPDQGLSAFRPGERPRRSASAPSTRRRPVPPRRPPPRRGRPGARGGGRRAGPAGTGPCGAEPAAPRPAGNGTTPRTRAPAARDVRLWRCANERAQAQAVAREVESLLATGARGARGCASSPGRRGGRGGWSRRPSRSETSRSGAAAPPPSSTGPRCAT